MTKLCRICDGPLPKYKSKLCSNIECKREDGRRRMEKWRQNNPEKARENSHKNHRNNREKELEYSRKNYWDNKELKFCIVCDRPLPKHKESLCSPKCCRERDNEKSTNAYWNNPEKFRERKRKDYQNNPEKILKRNKINRLRRAGLPEDFIEAALKQKPRPTDIETIAESWLLKDGIPYEAQKRIELPPTFTKVDFHIPDMNICWYTDGDFDHRRDGAKEHDERQTKALKSKGYKVVRTWGVDIHNGIKPLEIFGTPSKYEQQILEVAG